MKLLRIIVDYGEVENHGEYKVVGQFELRIVFPLWGINSGAMNQHPIKNPKPLGMHRANHPELHPPRKRKAFVKSGKPPAIHHWGEPCTLNPVPYRKLDWYNRPNEVKRTTCEVSRTKKVSPLTRISQKLARKVEKVIA